MFSIRYILTFRPTSPTPGPHALHLSITDRPGLAIISRTQYWIDDVCLAGDQGKRVSCFAAGDFFGKAVIAIESQRAA